MDVLSLFTSNRRAQKVAYKDFQYTKERDANTDTGVKIYWRCENVYKNEQGGGGFVRGGLCPYPVRTKSYLTSDPV